MSFDHFGFDAVSLQGRQILYKDASHQVIHFVLNANREQIVGHETLRLSVLIEESDFNRLSSLDFVVHTGYGQTPFFAHNVLGAGAHNGGVDHHQRFVFLLRHIQNDQALMEIDLSGGQANALGLVHGLKHVGDGGFESLVKARHRFSNCVQFGVWIAKDR